jgi:hypothetical protein
MSNFQNDEYIIYIILQIGNLSLFRTVDESESHGLNWKRYWSVIQFKVIAEYTGCST